MKQIYFNIWNGEVGEPSKHLPAYRVTTHGMKIVKIETCFSASNIASNGMDWLKDRVNEEFHRWDSYYPHLFPSLKKFILREYLKHPFRHTNFTNTNFRFPFIQFWVNEKRSE